MINFEQRIETLKRNCEKYILNERLAEYHFRAIKHLIDPYSISVYDNSIFVYLDVNKVEEIELSIIPALSDIYQNGKWLRFVNETSISYEADFLSFGYHVHIRIYWANTKNNSCSIKAYPTGRTKTTTKMVEITEPEIEYKIHCSD